MLFQTPSRLNSQSRNLAAAHVLGVVLHQAIAARHLAEQFREKPALAADNKKNKIYFLFFLVEFL
jgi:hypothetical protein